MAINKLYLQNIEKIKQTFRKNKALSSIQLHDFFIPECYEQIKRDVKKLKFKKSYLATSHSYQESNFNVVPTEVIDFLSKITGKKVKKLNLKALVFSWKDYIIINDKLKEKPGIDVIFDLTEDWNENSGGSIVYVNGSGEYFRIPPKGNSLLIVERKKGTQKFVQYMNHYSKNKKRYLVIASI